MPGLPSLSLLSDEVASELTAQERRGDALDTKAGVLLGFAGVLVGLTVDQLHGFVAHSGTVLAGVAALLAAVAFVPRSYPTLALRRLRETYLTADAEFTRRRVMDTRIAMYERTQGLRQSQVGHGRSGDAVCGRDRDDDWVYRLRTGRR
jgi:hypothetical protein